MKRSRPETDPAVAANLDRLRKTFAPGGSKPQRFRLMKELGELWGDTPPVQLLLFEATDPDAPPKYREYFARTLRKLGKMSPAEVRVGLAATMRDAMITSPAGALDLAHALIAFDDSTASLRTVESLLRSPSDDATTAGYLAALILSHNSEVRSIVLHETRSLAADPDAYPLSLSTVLPALAREHDLRVDSEIVRVISKSQDPDLFLTALRSGLIRQPGGAAIQTVRTALERVEYFTPEHRKQFRHLIRSGLLRWTETHPNLSPVETKQINELLDEIS